MGTFDRVSPGDPGSKNPAKKAAWLNSVSEAAEAYQNQGGRPRPEAQIGKNSGLIKIRNDLLNLIDSESPQHLKRGHYVQLGAYLLNKPDPDNALNKVDHLNPWYEGKRYDESESARIAILVKAALGADPDDEESEGEIMPARILGKCTAIINVTNVDHHFAAPNDGKFVLKSAESGTIEILTPITATGEQEVDVLMGSGGGGGATVAEQYARCKVTIEKATSNLVDDWVQVIAAAQMIDNDTGIMDPDPDHYRTVINRWPVEIQVDTLMLLDTSYTPYRVKIPDCFPQDSSFWQEPEEEEEEE